MVSSQSVNAFTFNRSVAAQESINAARELGGTVVQSFNGLLSMAWDGTGDGDLLGDSPRQSRSYSTSFDFLGKSESYDDEEFALDDIHRMERRGSSSADSDLEERTMGGDYRMDFSSSPPLGSMRSNVRKTSDDFGDMLMMNDDLGRSSTDIGPSEILSGSSGLADYPKPHALHQRTQSDSAAASSHSNSWRVPLYGGSSPPPASENAEEAASPSMKRNDSQGMLRSRSSVCNDPK